MNIFLLTPFSSEFQDIHEAIKRASNGTGFNLLRADLMTEAGAITTAIQKEIMDANLVIADITYKNPNVMYELGLAFALKKASIIIFQKGETVPFDITINKAPPLLKAAEERGTVILPVILKPCRFTSNPNLSKFQAINDPTTPLSKMNENDRGRNICKDCRFHK